MIWLCIETKVHILWKLSNRFCSSDKLKHFFFLDWHTIQVWIIWTCAFTIYHYFVNLAEVITVCSLYSSSTAAGILSTLVTAPIDIVKTRLMLQREAPGIRIYKGGFHCAYQVLTFFLFFSTSLLLLYPIRLHCCPIYFYHSSYLHKLLAEPWNDIKRTGILMWWRWLLDCRRI